MREKFSEKVYLGTGYRTTSTESPNEFRESAHVWHGVHPIVENTVWAHFSRQKPMGFETRTE